jgi:hypothetical protein
MRPICLVVGFTFMLAALPSMSVEPVAIEPVAVADGANSFAIQLGRSTQGIKGPIRILERGVDGTLSTVETMEAADPQRVQLSDAGRLLEVRPSQPIPPGSTWVVDLTGVCGCRPYTPAPPVRGLWKSSTGSVPVTTQSPVRIVQACACDSLVPISPLAFSAPAAAPVAAAAAGVSSLGWIILGAAAVVGAVVGITTTTSGGGGGGNTNRNLILTTTSR